MVTAMFLAGCSNDSDDAGDASVQTATTTTTASAQSTSAPDSTANAEEGGAEIIVIEPASGPMATATSSALGGIRISYPAELTYLGLDDAVIVSPPA